jgi:hypothetical protein
MGPLQDSYENLVFQLFDFTSITHVASNYQTKCDLSPYCSLNIIHYLVFLHIHYVIPKNALCHNYTHVGLSKIFRTDAIR